MQRQISNAYGNALRNLQFPPFPQGIHDATLMHLCIHPLSQRGVVSHAYNDTAWQ